MKTKESIQKFLSLLGKEAQLQNQCWYWLEYNRKDLFFHTVPNEGKRQSAETWRLKLLGMKKGVFDSIIFSCETGKLAYFEFKAPKKKLSTDQITFSEKLEKAKIDFFVIEYFEQFQKTVSNFFG